MLRSIAPIVIGAAVGAAATSGVLYIQVASVEPELTGRSTTSSVGDEQRPGAPGPATQIPAGPDELETLGALSLIERPANVRAASLALIDVAGRDLDSIARIADVLPEADRLNFTFDAIAAIAAEDPASAIQLALALHDLPAQSEAIRRVAKVLARVDPQSALVNADAISDFELADVFRNTVLEEWAGNEPEGFLAFIETAAPSDIRGAGDAFAMAAAIQPENLLAMLDRIPQSARLSAERAALDVLVTTNTGVALAHLESLPMGNARESLYRSTAESYAEHDLDAALAWADSLQAPSDSAMNGVLWVLTKSDPVRSVDVLIAKLQAGGGPNAGFNANLVLQAFTPGPPELMSVVAQRLSSVDNTAVNTMYDSFMDDWARDDPEAAYDWVFANPDRLTTSAVGYLAMNLGSARPELAKQAADRLPPDLQGMWIRVVADQLARSNLDDALQWIDRYQGQPVYRQALGAALQSASLGGRVENPESLALFLDQQSADVRADSVAVVANAWAERDPAAAARWVERTELTDATEDRRGAAISNVAARWAARDAVAAEDWALGLTAGENRDRALGSVLSVTSGNGRVETRLLQAFSSDAAAQRSLAGTMTSLGRSDPDLGRELIERYITDPALRAQAEERLVQGVSGPSMPTGNVVSLR